MECDARDVEDFADAFLGVLRGVSGRRGEEEGWMDGWMGCGFEGENPLLFLRRAVVGAPFGYESLGGCWLERW